MIQTIRALQFITIFASFTCQPAEVVHVASEAILIDAEHLARSKTRIEQGDADLIKAFNLLMKEANLALNKGPYSVTDKEKLPPSGDAHDYASYSRYWWPDPDQPNGLPYLRRDGETNPASQSLKESDRSRIGAFGMHTETLGLAYFLTGDKKYADKAAELLKVWFLNSDTRMNPNLNHAQCRPGHNTGSKSGVLDGRILIQALEGSLLIAHSGALSETEYQQLREWAGAYLEWLITDPLALAEADSKNNHGSYYDVQALYFGLYSGHKKISKRVAETFAERRIHSQIQPDGSMPEEMARTRPLFYSMYNLHALFLTAHLAEKLDIDVWHKEDKDYRLRSALDYLVPYTDPNIDWPHTTLGSTDRMKMLPLLQIADDVYPDGNYWAFVEKLPVEKRTIQRINIAYPLMR